MKVCFGHTSSKTSTAAVEPVSAGPDMMTDECVLSDPKLPDANGGIQATQ